MSILADSRIHSYLNSLIQMDDPLLLELENDLLSRNYPIIDRDLGQFLRLICTAVGPRRILEIGSAEGYSAIWMLRGCPAYTEFVGIELKAEAAAAARHNLARAGYSKTSRIVTGDANCILDTLTGRFDIIFIDAAKAQYPRFLDKCIPILSESGLLIADNILIEGYVLPDTKVGHRMKTMQVRLREFVDRVVRDRGFITSLVPVADGVLVACRRPSSSTEECRDGK